MNVTHTQLFIDSDPNPIVVGKNGVEKITVHDEGVAVFDTDGSGTFYPWSRVEEVAFQLHDPNSGSLV